MRNRIRKHCNAINAKGGEVNNNFQHLFDKTNRPEAHFDHAPFCQYNSCYQGGIAIDTTAKKVYKKCESVGIRKPEFLLTRLIHSICKSDSFEI